MEAGQKRYRLCGVVSNGISARSASDVEVAIPSRPSSAGGTYRDWMDNGILIGNTTDGMYVGLKVEGINNNEPFDFEPGMYVYLPRGTHHQVFPKVSRVSFSFGVEGDPDPSKYY